MRRFVYRLHTWLGLIVAIPVIAWASSGLLYALPNVVEGGKIENIDATRLRVSPSEAMARANEFADKQLPTTALTLVDARGTAGVPGDWRDGRRFALDRCGNRGGH